jgi:branched-chain amino acid transport system substrate-binding protein
MLGYQPKQVFATRGALFYVDVAAWGGDLPQGVCNEMFWNPSIQVAKGIGDTTPMVLYERWAEESGQPLNQVIGIHYAQAQVVFDALERAGSLDADKIQAALAQTDLMTIYHRVVFDKDQYSRLPVAFGQWQSGDNGEWLNPIVYSDHDFMPATAEMLFPIPYD